MSDKGIFKIIWRINAVLLLVLCTGGTYFMLDEHVGNILESLRREPERVVIRDDTLKLGNAILVGNGDYYLYPLTPGGGWCQEGLWLDRPARNFLVVDAETNESRWMFPDTNHHVIMWEEITIEADCGFESVGFQLVDVGVDSNGDGHRNNVDQSRRLVAAGFGYEPRDLVGEAVYSFWCEENDGRLFCQFTTEQGHESALYLLDENMTLVDRSVLPEVPSVGGAGDG